MDAETMEKTIQELRKKVAVLEDLEAIKRLQRTYGYYLEHWLYQDIIDCFSDRPDSELNLRVGVYLGKEGVRNYFSGFRDTHSRNPELLHQVMQLAGVVDIAEDGLTASGRWFGFGVVALPVSGGVNQAWADGIYTAEYIKEDGTWKIWKITWNPTMTADPTQGWVKPERLAEPGTPPPAPPCTPDKTRDIETRYPSGYVTPFHYPHPVTGRPTTELEHNRAVMAKRSRQDAEK